MRKLSLVGVCLLLGLLVGLTLRPDDGTQVSISHPAETGAALSGANHAKPLPGTIHVEDLVRQVTAIAGLVAVALVLAPSGVAIVVGDAERRPSDPAARPRAVTRRGPPALV
ncbi:MAG TPA: hypothetical protein VFY82_04460 [Acidimicrobiales bacterium]|nr:hypothetical protein [Acidimicrobiales bacterium]